jgi:hypothetical protein
MAETEKDGEMVSAVVARVEEIDVGTGVQIVEIVVMVAADQFG